MRYQLAIFDFDGTLADSFPWFSRTINDIADRFHFKRIEPHEADELRAMDARALMRHLGIPAWKVPFIANHMRKRKSKEIDQTRLFDGVDRMLQRLSTAGIAMALVSSNSESNARTILGAQNAGLIGYYECGASLLGKSSRFRRVLRRSRMQAGNAICIGDEIRDLEAARKAGIDFGAVTWGYTAPSALVALAPAVVFQSIDCLADCLWPRLPSTGRSLHPCRSRHAGALGASSFR
jgi:phosphoglycolate phosphatase